MFVIRAVESAQRKVVMDDMCSGSGTIESNLVVCFTHFRKVIKHIFSKV